MIGKSRDAMRLGKEHAIEYHCICMLLLTFLLPPGMQKTPFMDTVSACLSAGILASHNDSCGKNPIKVVSATTSSPTSPEYSDEQQYEVLTPMGASVTVSKSDDGELPAANRRSVISTDLEHPYASNDLVTTTTPASSPRPYVPTAAPAPASSPRVKAKSISILGCSAGWNTPRHLFLLWLVLALQ
jgi:hypothetical protein